MPCRDAKQRHGGTCGHAPILLPALERADANPHRGRELLLGETQKSPQRSHIACAEIPAHDAFSLGSFHHAAKILFRQLSPTSGMHQTIYVIAVVRQ